MNLLDRYIVKEHIAPFFMSISMIMLIFILNLLFRMLRRIVGQGLPLNVIGEFFFLNLAWILTLAIPMAVLMACLIAYGRMASDMEIVALKASGVGVVRLMRPMIIVGLLIGGATFYFMDQILPDFNYRNKLLTISIRRKKPNIAIKEGIFTRELSKQTILVREINEETGILYSVKIFDDGNPEQPATVVADSGMLTYIDTLGMYQFRLYSGSIHQMKPSEPESYETLDFTESIFRINSPEQNLHLRERGYRGDRELDLEGLSRRIEELRGRPNADQLTKQINRYRVEYHKKYSIPAATLIFVLIGAPLGIKLRKGGAGTSVVLSISFFLVYWIFLIGGEDIGDRGWIHPGLAMWAPNILLGLFGIFLIHMETRSHSTLRMPWQKKGTVEVVASDNWHLSSEEIEKLAEAELAKQQEPTPSEETGDEPVDESREDSQ